MNLPVFVFGTLRVGFGNHRTFPQGSITQVRRGRLDGATMSTIGFPYVWRTETGTVTGEVMTIDPAMYERTMRALDGLEGYRGPGQANHYEREIVEITLTETGETIRAYIYLVDEATGSRFTPVPSGDFADTRDPNFDLGSPSWFDDEDEDEFVADSGELTLGDTASWTSPVTGEAKPGILIDRIGDYFLIAFDDGTEDEVLASSLVAAVSV